MLIGIFSDTHLGFGGGEQYEESFDRMEEALKIFKEKNVSLILHAGDLFDMAVPDQEVWERAFQCFAKNTGQSSTLEKVGLNGKEEVSVRGIPFIAIHGTHEFRGKDFSNALDVLEEAGCLAHIHASKIVFEKDGEKVAIHGMGGVPEKNAKKVFEKYSPEPEEGAENILLMHQSFKEFLPFNDDSIASLSLADLPRGFDLIVGGHLHWANEQNAEGKRFLLAGSSIFTQMKKLEGKTDKGIFLYNTSDKKISFVPFKRQRKLFYHKLKFEKAEPEKVMESVKGAVERDLAGEFEMKPLVRIKLTGTLARGYSQSDITFDLPEKAIFSVSKNFSSDSFKKKMDSFKDEQLKKKGISELGVEILEKNISDAGLEEFDARRIFELLSAGETEKAEKVLLEK